MLTSSLLQRLCHCVFRCWACDAPFSTPRSIFVTCAGVCSGLWRLCQHWRPDRRPAAHLPGTHTRKSLLAPACATAGLHDSCPAHAPAACAPTSRTAWHGSSQPEAHIRASAPKEPAPRECCFRLFHLPEPACLHVPPPCPPQISTEYVRNVADALSVGQSVTVRVLNVDLERGKFAGGCQVPAVGAGDGCLRWVLMAGVGRCMGRAGPCVLLVEVRGAGCRAHSVGLGTDWWVLALGDGPNTALHTAPRLQPIYPAS